ncbi:hypothetical protein SOVF_057730 [Spinacia oleracea]|uniref:Large ribosomal subunit protein uL5c n=3 Tax=Spinacia oleracea TaxID=3562 RepID=RK5_SPIOL|nr:RecName: Full=Large ribosomal subunit protein uL5c; AltName: Full=50S ribosomal protein L5, chloroplastic; Flags: Precursor [Spinacia oleracea]KNA19821.1 hypothetical protein SOVF_057730 [Spinacia oleracea]5MMI_F Chain F, plastid ribosomal protein uL5c [Spinacia oleracea]5MMM_F Chain F, plastid ribosomal protein uL5c [Spinacia oleracea]
MASTSLLQSTSSSFAGVRFHCRTSAAPRVGLSSFTVKAAAGTAVFVDKAEAETINRLKTNYIEKMVPLLKEEFSYSNILEVPKVVKIVVNCGIGDASQNAKGLDAAINELALITGQRPVKTKAKTSIAGFKVREGMTLGIAVTLRGNLMYSFLDRLINLALPRTRDFQGVNPNSFDGHGNYSVGFREQSVFPEIKPEIVGKARGMDVCITTTAKTDKEAYKLLSLMGMPFREGSGPSTLVRKKKLKSHHFDAKKGRRY